MMQQCRARRRLRVLAAVCGVLVAAGAAAVEDPGAANGVSATAAPRSGVSGVDFVPGEVLVEFEDRIGTQSVRDMVAAQRDFVVAALANRPGMATVRLDSGRSVADAVRAYAADPRIRRVQPNYIYRVAATVPDDTDFDLLWGLDNNAQLVDGVSGTAGADIGAPEAWDLLTDCTATRVAVLDTGINYRHADLAGNMWAGDSSGAGSGRDFVGDDDDPMATGGTLHGTHVASTIGAVGDNAAGIAGVCWRAEIMAVRVIGPDGAGNTADIIEGVDYAVANGARVLNLSLGGDNFDPALHDALAAARDQGVMVVTAAGNSGRDVDPGQAPVYPCSFDLDNIVCVAALDQDYSLAGFSNYGSVAVDLGAPGVNILGHLPGPRTAFDWSSWQRDPAWGVDACRPEPGAAVIPLLVNPDDWCGGGLYANNLDARAYAEFDLSDSIGAGYGYRLYAEAADAGDSFIAGHEAGASPGDPFDQGVADFSSAGPGTLTAYDVWSGVADCVGTRCAVGFRLLTDGSGRAGGVAVARGVLQRVVDGATASTILDGTSMATPHVTGIAALAWSAVPEKGYAAIRAAVLAGGDDIIALDGLTATGRAADAFGAVAAANDPPTMADLVAETVENTAVDIPLSANDPNDHPLTFSLAEAPAHGSVAVADGSARYTPADGFVGTDSFRVSADDGFTGTVSAAVEVQVTEAADNGDSESGGGGGGGCALRGGGGTDPLLPMLVLLALTLRLRRPRGRV